ncbi:ubiquinol-cytochrome-c reductase complex assembly factor 1 [Centruroides vittatus]|uniref:ubiquinol-cytochrome-c reductase complex assembly factor 1 n=1 Tax=Centruroides vittatus TaxID=120091 RepID=UPI0035105544
MTNRKGSIKSLTSSKLLNFPISKPSIPDQDGFFKKIGKEIKWNFYVKGKRESSAIYIYEACADNIDVKEFFSYFKLPDTFHSWFLVIELHVWMCMTRAMNEEKGKYLRNKIVNAMWEDTETRIKMFEGVSPQARKETLIELFDQFKAAVVSYDEGFLGDDMDLAAALWRVFFSYKCHNPCILETLVHYVRKHMFYLDHLNTEEYYKGNIKWSSLKEFKIQEKRCFHRFHGWRCIMVGDRKRKNKVRCKSPRDPISKSS